MDKMSFTIFSTKWFRNMVVRIAFNYFFLLMFIELLSLLLAFPDYRSHVLNYFPCGFSRLLAQYNNSQYYYNIPYTGHFINTKV